MINIIVQDYIPIIQQIIKYLPQKLYKDINHYNVKILVLKIFHI